MLHTAIHFGTECTCYGCISPSHVSVYLKTFKYLCRGYLNIFPTQTVQLKHLSVFFMSLMSPKADDMSYLNKLCRSRSHFHNPAPAFLSFHNVKIKTSSFLFSLLACSRLESSRDYCGVNLFYLRLVLSQSFPNTAIL